MTESPPEAPAADRGLRVRLRSWSARHCRLALAIAALCTATAANLAVVIVAWPRVHIDGALGTRLLGAQLLPPSLGAASLAPPPLAHTQTAPEPGQLEISDDPARAPKAVNEKKEKKFRTVSDAAARSCSTSSVDGLSRQIIAQARCVDPGAFVPLGARSNVEARPHVFLYFDRAARDALGKVLQAHSRRTMKIHSALRTVAQQYLLSRWASQRKCGIQLATAPGDSNHETGLALDISDARTWRPALEANGFRWLGSIDRVHFDYKGEPAASHTNVDVTAFQQLWNRNHPDDRITVNGQYDAATEQRLKKAPAAGFPLGGSCATDSTGGGGSHARGR